MLFDYHLIIYVGKCVARYLRSVGNWSALLLITWNLVPVSLTKYLVIFKTRNSQSRRNVKRNVIQLCENGSLMSVFSVCFLVFFFLFLSFFLITNIFTRATVLNEKH